MTTSSTRQCWFRNAHRFSFIFWSFWISNNNCTAIKINNTYINVLDIQRFLWRSYTSLTSRIKQSYPSPFPPEASQNEKANAVLWSQMASNEPLWQHLLEKSQHIRGLQILESVSKIRRDLARKKGKHCFAHLTSLSARFMWLMLLKHIVVCKTMDVKLANCLPYEFLSKI